VNYYPKQQLFWILSTVKREGVDVMLCLLPLRGSLIAISSRAFSERNDIVPHIHERCNSMIIQSTGVVTSPMRVTQPTEEMEALALYHHATNDLAAAHIYLQSNSF
jgi:hypothetical protein